MIKGLTFDIWDTLVIDDSDEIVRAKAGLPSKKQDRILKVFEISKAYKNTTLEEVEKAYETNLLEFNKNWHDNFITEKVHDRLINLFALLNIKPKLEDLQKAARYWEEMEYHIPPAPAPNVNPALKELAKNYKLAIISDAIVTPGRLLRKILEKYDMLKYFSVFSFSDEVGVSKPSPRVFEVTLKNLALPASSVAHIGDRPYNDIDGPQKVGMKGILYTGIRKRELGNSKPDAIFDDYRKLVDIVKKLQGD